MERRVVTFASSLPKSSLSSELFSITIPCAGEPCPAVPVFIDSNGHLGTVSSSRRYKEDIQDMGEASDGLMQLRPVIFRYKRTYEVGSKPIQYGLIAEEVAAVYPDMAARPADRQVEAVKYQLLDPMLLNELQKQHATIEAQKEQVGALEERLARLEAAFGFERMLYLDRPPGPKERGAIKSRFRFIPEMCRVEDVDDSYWMNSSSAATSSEGRIPRRDAQGSQNSRAR